MAALLAALAVALVVGFAGMAVLWLRADDQRRQAEQARGDAEEQKRRAEGESARAKVQEQLALRRELLGRRNAYAADIILAWQTWDSATLGRLDLTLDRQRPAPGGEDLRGFEWHYLWKLGHGEKHRLSATGVRHLALSRDGTRLAALEASGMVRLWELPSEKTTHLPTTLEKDGRIVAQYVCPTDPRDSRMREALVLSPDERTIAALVLASTGSGKDAPPQPRPGHARPFATARGLRSDADSP